MIKSEAAKEKRRIYMVAYHKIHYAANKVKYNEAAKAKHLANPEVKRRYDAQRRKTLSKELAAFDRARNELRRGGALMIWTRARSRAKRYGLPFSIKVSDVVVPDLCPVLGIKLKPIKGARGGHDASPSLDKIKPELGYVPGNVVVISKKANCIKHSATASEVMAVAIWMQTLPSANQVAQSEPSP